jgi:RsiW-degrading membrane proteinase PrsW (M82 family)
MLAHIPAYLSVPLWSLLVIPAVYMTQVVFLAFATNLPLRIMLGAVLFGSALIEEVVKSIGLVVLVEHEVVKSTREMFGLAFLSALGFLIGEKLLLLVSISVVSQAPVAGALFGAGIFLLIPLAAHFIFTSLVTFLRTKVRLSYPLALAIGTGVHFVYNWVVMRGGLG